MNPRDTQFEGFAKTLRDELEALTHGRVHVPSSEVTQLIARRAYDLVAHTVDSIKGRVDQYSAYIILADDAEQIVRNIPDMTELPKEQE